MSEHTRLSGWDVKIRETREPVANPSGEPRLEEFTELVFVERKPETGNTITFRMNRAGKDQLVQALTHGIVLASGELPRL